jgi:hypothetical protein
MSAQMTTTSASSSTPVRPWTILAVVAGNAVPLLGVLLAGWSVLTILVLYWLESAVVGVFNVAKIAAARGPAPASYSGPTHPAAVAVFFSIHYGMFWVVHGVFAIMLGIGAGGGFDPSGLLLALPWLVAVHAYDHVVEYRGKQEHLRVSPAEQLFRPYGRVIAMHVAVLGGSFLLQGAAFGSAFGLLGEGGGGGRAGAGVGAIALLVVVKTAFDVGGLVVDHQRIRRRGPAEPPAGGVAQVPPPPAF